MTDYYKQYRDKHSNVKEACECINANSCSKLRDEIESIKSHIDGISLSGWTDSASDEFITNKDICSNKLGIIVSSIESVFMKSEAIYLTLNQELDNLCSLNNKFQSTKKPKLEDYTEKVYFTNEEGKREYLRTDTNWSKYKEAQSNYDSLIAECENCVENVKKYFNYLEFINNTPITEKGTNNFLQQDIQISISVIPNFSNSSVKNYRCTILKGTTISQTGAKALEKALGSGNVTVSYYEGTNKIGVRYNQGKGAIWNSKENRVDGFLVHENGCGLLSIAGVLTSVLSSENGCITYVTPTDLASDLSDYSKTNKLEGNGISTYLTNSDGLLGDYHALGKAISEIYGVSVVVNQNPHTSGFSGLSYDNYVDITNSNTGIVYSCNKESHINAVFYANNNKVYECDTSSGCKGYLLNGTQIDSSKRAIYISSQDSFNVDNGYLTLNGDKVNFDIGNATEIIVDNTTYGLTKTSEGYQVNNIEVSNSTYLENLSTNAA